MSFALDNKTVGMHKMVATFAIPVFRRNGNGGIECSISCVHLPALCKFCDSMVFGRAQMFHPVTRIFALYNNLSIGQNTIGFKILHRAGF